MITVDTDVADRTQFHVEVSAPDGHQSTGMVVRVDGRIVRRTSWVNGQAMRYTTSLTLPASWTDVRAEVLGDGGAYVLDTRPRGPGSWP